MALSVGLMCVQTAVGAGAHESAPASVAHYTLLDLGYFQQRQADERPSLNRAGHAAAWQVINQTRVVATLIEGGQSTTLTNASETTNGYAFGINSKDDVVGILESAADLRDTQAFHYHGGSLDILSPLGGKTAAARAVNEAGLIVGNAQTATMKMHAATWKGGQVQDLGTLGEGDLSRGYAVNERGDVAGEANLTANGKVHGALWSGGHGRDLGLLPGGSFSSAQAINDHGVAVGFADDEAGGTNPVRFSNGKVESVGSLGDEPGSALGINDAGQIVGTSPVAEGQMRAFLWERGHIYDLNNFIPPKSDWLLLGAFRINASGQILAFGFHQGHVHLCVLTAQRPPATKPAVPIMRPGAPRP